LGEGAQTVVTHNACKLGHGHSEERVFHHDEGACREVFLRHGMSSSLCIEIYAPRKVCFRGFNAWQGVEFGTLHADQQFYGSRLIKPWRIGNGRVESKIKSQHFEILQMVHKWILKHSKLHLS